MADYRISGIWKNEGGITHYAIQLLNIITGEYEHIKMYDKVGAIGLVKNGANQVKTRMWDYRNSIWVDGAHVHVVGEKLPLQYLRTDKDNVLRDNLGHLIDYSDYLKQN